jgi:tRNA(Leu) C34 or U34 (ribose-2'-O)-methylase TrmL
VPRILLIDPKSPFNVGGVQRACHIFGASTLAWTGHRVLHASEVPKKYRLPREERMKEYRDVSLLRLRQSRKELARLLRRQFETEGTVPVCVEVLPQAEPLPQFVHPQEATYLFGPEDGAVPAPLRAQCHRFLRIPSPTRTPLNLAVAVNLVLYDRCVKEMERKENHVR